MNQVKLVLLILLIFNFMACTKSEKQKLTSKIKNHLTVERLYGSPKLSGDFPKGLKISPDGEKVTFLKGKEDNFDILDLWEFDLKTGKPQRLVDSKVILGDGREKVSDEERARRERKRIRESGIVEYQWSSQGDKLLFPIGGDIYIYDTKKKNPVVRITQTKAFEIDPRFSPKGNFISFVKNNNIYIVDLKTMKEKAITRIGTKEMPIGVAEFVAQEEMSRYRGYWWSPDEKYIAASQVDNRPVANVKRFEVYSDKLSVVEQKYPKAGKANAIIKLAIFEIKKTKPLWVPIEVKDYYIPSVRWASVKGKSVLTYTLQTRDQKNLSFWSYQPSIKKEKKIFEENDSAWVNIRHDFLFLKNRPELLWISEKSGHAHIHLIDLEKGSDRPLTSGDWEVTALHAVDEESGTVFFSGTKESPLENHLYKISLFNEADPMKVSQSSQLVVMSKKPKFYLGYSSSQLNPPALSLYDLSGERKFYIAENAVNKKHPLYKYKSEMSSWEFGDVELKDKTKLYYKVLKPKNFDPQKKYPVVQYVYGGPGVQLVTKGWSRQNLFHQLLAQKGYVVLVADNRGTPHRGRDFERSYYLNFGQQEVLDQSFVLEHLLKKNSYMDKKNVGVFGHSYGGYLTLMLLFQKSELYKAGVSGAPVVDWTYYDTHYTERYMGKPQDNKELYEKSNVLSYVDGYKGNILVVHGMADDNVLYNHSLILYQELQDRGKLFDIMAYPGAKHGIRRKKAWSIHYFGSIVNYFEKHLKD